jgi:hypothetical protein
MLVALFGWPAVVVSLVTSTVGLVARRWWLLAIAAMISLPCFGYLAMTPRFRGVAMVPPLLQLLAAVVLRYGSRFYAVLLSLPTLLFSGYVFSVVSGG